MRSSISTLVASLSLAQMSVGSVLDGKTAVFGICGFAHDQHLQTFVGCMAKVQGQDFACYEACGCTIDWKSLTGFVLCIADVQYLASIAATPLEMPSPSTRTVTVTSTPGTLTKTHTVTSTRSSSIKTITVTATATALSPRSPLPTPTVMPRPINDCYFGGPCDCAVVDDKSSDEYLQCVTNPLCEHCFMDGVTLTHRPKTTGSWLTKSKTTTTTTITTTCEGCAMPSTVVVERAPQPAKTVTSINRPDMRVIIVSKSPFDIHAHTVRPGDPEW